MMEHFFHGLWHATLHTLPEFLSLLPFLFLTFLFMEWLEHRTGERAKEVLSKSGRFAPLLGGALGAVPQCGFSAAAAGLYAGRVVGLGTLIAVFLSTSDEMLAILLSHVHDGEFAWWSLFRILGTKMVLGVGIGFLVDLAVKLLSRREEHHHSHHAGEGHEEHHHESICHMCEDAGCHCQEEGILKSSLRHTFSVGWFLVVCMLVLNLTVELIGEDRLTALSHEGGFLTLVLSALVGLIPSCAASVAITELYVAGTISTGALYAGLLPASGVGVLVLLRTNKPLWKSLAILGGLVAVGIAVGGLIDLFNLDFLGLAFH